MDMVGVRTMEFCRRWGIVGAVESSAYNRDLAQDNVYVTSLTGYELSRERFPSMRASKPPEQSPQKRERCPQDMFDPILARLDARVPQRRSALPSPAHRVRAARRRRHRAGARPRVGSQRAKSKRSTSSVATARAAASPKRSRAAWKARRCSRRRRTSSSARRSCCRCTTRAKRIASSSSVPRACGARSSRSTAGTVGACRSPTRRDEGLSRERHRRRDPARGRSRLRVRDPVGHVVDAARTRRADLRAGPRVHRRRCGARHVADRRLRHEHRHRRCGRPRRGSSTRCCTAGAAQSYWTPIRIERRPVAVRNGRESSANLARMLSPGKNPALCDDTPEGAACRAELGPRYAEAMSHEWYTLGIHLGYRYDDSPICWPDGTAAPPLEVATLRARIATRRARAARLAERRPLDARSLRRRLRSVALRGCGCGTDRHARCANAAFRWK